MKLTKFLALILAILMLVSCFAACDSKDDDEDEEYEEEADEKKDDEEEADLDIDVGTEVKDVEITASIRFIVTDKETGAKETILERNSYTMVGPEEEMNALSFATKTLYEYEVLFSADETLLTKVKDYENVDGFTDTHYYGSYWVLYVNGEKGKEGRYNKVMIEDGDVIEFVYEHYESPRQDT